MGLFRAIGAIVRAKGWPEPMSPEAHDLANEIDHFREVLGELSYKLRGEATITWQELTKLRAEARKRRKNWVEWVASKHAGVPFGRSTEEQRRVVVESFQQFVRGARH